MITRQPIQQQPYKSDYYLRSHHKNYKLFSIGVNEILNFQLVTLNNFKKWRYPKMDPSIITKYKILFVTYKLQ